MHFDIWKLADFNIMVSLLILAAAWRWGNWRNWQKYYPTILFFILADYAYGYITYNQPLWQYESPLLKTTLSDLFVSLIGYPSLILLFLQYYPKGIYKRIVYISLWVILHFTLIELLALKLGFFSYHNGWNVWYAFLFDCFMFPMFRLHYKKPLIVWIITFIMFIALFSFFHISISNMK